MQLIERHQGIIETKFRTMHSLKHVISDINTYKGCMLCTSVSLQYSAKLIQ